MELANMDLIKTRDSPQKTSADKDVIAASIEQDTKSIDNNMNVEQSVTVKISKEGYEKVRASTTLEDSNDSTDTQTVAPDKNMDAMKVLEQIE